MSFRFKCYIGAIGLSLVAWTMVVHAAGLLLDDSNSDIDPNFTASTQ